MRSVCVLLALSFMVAACGGAKSEAKSPESEAEASKPAAEKETEAEKKSEPAETQQESSAEPIPTKCAKSSPPCTPPVSFIKKLCNGNFPSVALYMFGNKLPFTKGYLTRRTQAWNAAGGASSSGWVEFDEEVLILLERAADTGGMQVSGAGGGYEALRWDGSCVTLAKEEVTLDKPPAPKAAKIEFRFIDDKIQEALRADENVNTQYLARRKECKGATSGEVSAKCVKADAGLSEAVVAYLRKGGSVPVPEKLP